MIYKPLIFHISIICLEARGGRRSCQRYNRDPHRAFCDSEVMYRTRTLWMRGRVF